MNKKQKITWVFTIGIILNGCATAPGNTVWEQYHSKMKSIKPGFHMLGSYDNTYRLKYVGESNTTTESAKEIWMEQAKGICRNSQKSANTTNERVAENTRTEYHGNPNDDASVGAVCAVTGFVGCLIVEILSTDYIVESKIKYPEVEGTIDCNPA